MSKQVLSISGNYVKANVDFNNLQGCDVYALDSDLENLEACIFVPVDFEGNPTRTSVIGYTKNFDWRNGNTRIFPRLDGEMELPLHGFFSFDDIVNSSDFNTLLFAKFKSVNEMRDVLELSDAQTGKCKDQTDSFYGIPLIVNDIDIFITNDNGDTITL